jgi:hypothetical protein
MEVKQVIEKLTQMFKGRDWFNDVGTDQYGRYIVYMNFMTNEALTGVPDTIDGKQVLVHFAGSEAPKREQYVNVDKSVYAVPAPIKVVEEEVSINIELLVKELERLEKICGSNILQDIFYEVHDGNNAVTNLSDRYPEVRFKVEELYEEYGFDIIYENLDG